MAARSHDLALNIQGAPTQTSTIVPVAANRGARVNQKVENYLASVRMFLCLFTEETWEERAKESSFTPYVAKLSSMKAEFAGVDDGTSAQVAENAIFGLTQGKLFLKVYKTFKNKQSKVFRERAHSHPSWTHPLVFWQTKVYKLMLAC